MIIGINGPIGSGKNEVANILEKNWGFKAVGFADKLKESASALFDIKKEDWEIIKNDPGARISLTWGYDNREGQWNNEVSITGREFLKRYGTEAHRDVFWNDIWVDVFFHPYEADEGNIYAPDLAIYDARFNNELEKIHVAGGVNIQVRRPGHEFDTSHSSEAPPRIDLIDYTLVNDGSLEDLEEKVNSLVRGERLVNLALSVS